MSEETKSCTTCAYSYYLTDAHDNPTEQCCSNEKYNAPEYTREMLMEDWDKGYCRFWTPKEERNNQHEKQLFHRPAQ